jgi:ParB family chromosome partitioning protein
VSLIAASMADTGQMQPIEVRQTLGAYSLVAGAHRLAAAVALEWTEIDAVVFGGTDIEAEIREIDENLFRRDLNPLDRAMFLGKRKALFDKQNPEAVRGKAGAAARWHARSNLNFALETEKKLGISKATVKRAGILYAGLLAGVRARLAGTEWAHKEAQIYALSRLDADTQRKVADLLLHPVQPRRSVAEACDELLERKKPVVTAEEDQYRRLLGVWTKAGKTARRQFIDHLVSSGELDVVRAAKKVKAA